MNRMTLLRLPSALVIALLLAGGCQKDSRPVSDYTLATGNETIPVKESWRQFALANYAGELLVDLRNSTDVRFLQPPTVTANRNVDTGRVQLVVLGELDETNRQGKRLRHPFYVAWEESGTGWKLVDRLIQPGQTAPPAPAPLDAPPAAPATVPATPAPASPTPAP